MLQSLHDPALLDGVNFDIEGLSDDDYMDLFATMRSSWNRIIKTPNIGQHMLLRFNFGNMQQLLAAEAIKSGFLDRIYWESYQSNPDLMTGDAMSILSTISDFNGNKGDRRVLLAFETNCCAKPCLDPGCYSCGTKPLPDWELKSFGLCQGRTDPSIRAQRVDYLLDTLDSVEMHLAEINVTRDGSERHNRFVACNYRGFKILLDDIDNGTEACPSSGRAKTVLGWMLTVFGEALARDCSGAQP